MQEWIPKWLPAYEAIRASKLPWSFEYFECVEEDEDKNMLIGFLSEEWLLNLSIPTAGVKTGKRNVHSNMETLYPSSLLLRYMPTGKGGIAWEKDAAIALPQAADSLSLEMNTEVFFFYSNLPPVLRLPLQIILDIE